jgi:hypothetical protein
MANGKRAARGRDTRMDDYVPEEVKQIGMITTVTCYNHPRHKEVEVITGNSSTGALSCGHVYDFANTYSFAPWVTPQLAVFHHGLQEVM